MDSTSAITKKIASSDLQPEVKRALATLFNLELRETNPNGASKLYLKELESLAKTWVPENSQKGL